MAKELAYLSPAAGISTTTLQLQAITSFTVADTWHCTFFPVASQAVPTFRTTPTCPGPCTHLHVGAWHGLYFSSANLSRNARQAYPCCLYGQSAIGELELHTAQKACVTELRMTKGLQGTVAYKNPLQDTVEEARLAYRRGVARTGNRWAFHSGHAQISDFVVPLLW